MLPGVTRYSVLARREWQEKCFRVPGMAIKGFRRSGNGKKSVLSYREWQEKCFGVVGMARKVFWRSSNVNESVLA